MKSRVLFSLVLIFIGQCLFAQGKFFTKTGRISFFSHTPMEDIDAVNNQVTSFLDPKTGDIVFAVLMKSFEFKKALMQEHFNENYVESEQFPKATLQGKITNLADVNFSKDGTYKVNVTGKLTLHGQTRDINEPAELVISGNTIKGHCVFLIAIADYEIKVPKVVSENISEKIEVTVDMNYQPYNQ